MSSIRPSAGSCTWGHHNPRQPQRLVAEAGKLPSGKGSGGTDPQWLTMIQCLLPGDQEGQWDPGLYQQWHGQQSQSSESPPVLSTGESHVQFWAPFTRKTQMLEHVQRRVTELGKDLESELYKEWLRESGCSARRGGGRPYFPLSGETLAFSSSLK